LLTPLPSFQKTDYNLTKNKVTYSTDWIEISDEPASPFYREKQQLSPYKSLFSSNCWLDLKFFPISCSIPAIKSRLKLIYLTIQSDDWTDKDLTTPTTTSPIRLLTIDTKFLINNKTNSTLKLEILTRNIPVLCNQHFIGLNDESESSVACQAYSSAAEILNTSEQGLEEDEENLIRNRVSDLFFMRVTELDKQMISFKQQSKLTVLSVNEKALKQISSTPSTNENSLISRQCFCLYSNTKTLPIICVQKLLINKNGRLLISLKEDTNCLAHIINCLDNDIYVWPRISSNFIFENYIRNTELLNEKIFRKSSARRQSSHQNTSHDRSLIFMHRIPARKCLKYNYDFIGTDHFPIENLTEQLFFMLACSTANNSFSLSPTLFRIFEDKGVDVTFEHETAMKWRYAAIKSDHENQKSRESIEMTRFITEKTEPDFLDLFYQTTNE